MIRAKMKPFPFVRMFLASIPAEEGAEILGISIKTFQRRKQEPEILTIGQLTLNPVNHTVTFGGEDVRLTNTEFELLRYLMQHKGEAVTREELLRDVWGYDYSGDTNVVDVYIRYLRTKLDQRFNIHTINTIRSVGYLFCYE